MTDARYVLLAVVVVAIYHLTERVALPTAKIIIFIIIKYAQIHVSIIFQKLISAFLHVITIYIVTKSIVLKHALEQLYHLIARIALHLVEMIL